MVGVHVVSHTHWDREWYLTREQFRLRLVDLIDRVLDRMDGDVRFEYFHLDGQTIVLEDYLEARPEEAGRLRRRIAEGRILVGPWYVMPDQFLVSGEALVRNLALGHRLAGGFGAVMPVGYIPDPFGHIAQMPQVLSGFGLDSAVLWRGFGGPRAEYWWQAPDGSRVLLLHLPREGYANALRLPLSPPEKMRERSAALIARERERSAFDQVLLMVGVDHVEPHPALPEVVARLAEEPGLQARQSTLPAYVDAVRRAINDGAGSALETVRGELRAGEEYAFLLPGVLSTRGYLKRANACAQNALEKWAEPLSLFAWLAGGDYPSGLLQYAWKTLLQNQPHDSICGCSIDAVHEENMSRFARVQQVADGLVERALAVLARSVETPLAGVLRYLVVNTDSRPYSGMVEAEVDLPFESAELKRSVRPELLEKPLAFFPRTAAVTSVTGPDGTAAPFQVLAEEERVNYVMSRFEPPWAVRTRRLHLAWWAEGVPGCGYSTFDLRLSEAPGPEHALVTSVPPVSAGEHWMENDVLRVDVNADGTLNVLDKRSGTVLARCGELEDTGDVGDEYNYSPPPADRRAGSAQAVAVRLVHAGPLRAAIGIDLELPVPAEASVDRKARSEAVVALPISVLVSLEAGSPRITWTATVDNAARDHRLRVLFPTGAAAVDTARADSAFAVVSRPARRPEPAALKREAPVSSAPMQSFVDVGDEHQGVTVFAEGLMEYEVLVGEDLKGKVPGGEGLLSEAPTTQVPASRQARLALTLLRCVGDLSRDDLLTRPGGHAGPALPTPGAQCAGRHELRFALEPRAAAPPGAPLFARARAFTAPPRAVPAGGGSRPRGRFSFLDFAEQGGGAVLSAAKKAEERDSIVLRLFNPGEAAARMELRCALPLMRAFRVDLLERRQEEIPLPEPRLSATLGPYQIQTFELIIGRSRTA